MFKNFWQNTLLVFCVGKLENRVEIGRTFLKCRGDFVSYVNAYFAIRKKLIGRYV